jgi:hypothetical protein
MFRLTAQLCVWAELEQAVAATTADNQVTWRYVRIIIIEGLVLMDCSALAQAQLVQVQSQVPAVVLVLPEVDMEVDSLLVVDLLVDHVLPLATSAEDRTTLPEIAKPRPWSATLVASLDTSPETALLLTVDLSTLLARPATSAVRLDSK